MQSNSELSWGHLWEFSVFFFPFFLYLNSCLQLVHQELGKKVNWIQYNSAAPLKLIEWVVRMKILTPFSTKFIPLYIINRKDHYSQIRNLCSCEKKVWKNSGLLGFQPWSLWYHCHTLINWSNKLTGSWIWNPIFFRLSSLHFFKSCSSHSFNKWNPSLFYWSLVTVCN